MVLMAELGSASLLHPLCNQGQTFWPEGVRGEPHPRGLPRLPTSVLLVSVMSHAQPHASCHFAWQLSKEHLAPQAPSDRLCTPKTEHSARDDKIKACFSSGSLTVQDSTG